MDIVYFMVTNKIIFNAVIYLGSSVLSKAAPFFLLPILTRYLAPEEYGILSIFMIINALYSALVGMSIQANVTKSFFKVDKQKIAEIIGNIMIILMAAVALYFTITLVLSLLYDTLFSVPTSYLLILPFQAFFVAVHQIHLTVLRNQERALLYAGFEFTNALANFFITIFFLLIIGAGWLSQVFGYVISAAMLCVIGFAYLMRHDYIKLGFSKFESWGILKLSLPLVPHTIGAVVIGMSDRLFIEKMVGLKDVALYSVGYTIAMGVLLLIDSTLKAWSPWFYKQLAHITDKKKRTIVLATYLYVAFIFIFAFIFALCADLALPYLVDDAYQGASDYIWVIAFSYAVFVFYKLAFAYLVHISKTQFLAISTVLSALVNLALNYWLISLYGAIGAAYATLASHAISSILVFEYQRRHYPMPWLLGGLKMQKS